MEKQPKHDEAVPSEKAPLILQAWAQDIAAYALARTGIIPSDIVEILTARADDLKTAQLARRYTQQQLECMRQEYYTTIDRALQLMFDQA